MLPTLWAAAVHVTMWSVYTVIFEQKRVTMRAALRPAAVFAMLFSVLLIAGGCGGNEQAAATEVPPAITAETGGMALGGTAESTDAAAAPSSDATTEAAAATVEPSPEPTVAAPVLDVGALITAADRVDVYADADPTAQRFGEYPAGTVLTVVEAGGEFAGYPVEVDGLRWYRVRAPDGLVGWVSEP